MTPKEEKFFLGLVEAAAQAAYERGYTDALAKNPSKKQLFTMTPAHALWIKTELFKFIQKR